MSTPAGVYACGCGEAHQLGASCPVAVSADRDDLARDVARLWALNTSTCGGPGGIALGVALDRLAAAYGPVSYTR